MTGTAAIAVPPLARIRQLATDCETRRFSKSYGVLKAIGATKAEVACSGLKLGDICRIRNLGAETGVTAEVIAAHPQKAVLTVLGDPEGLGAGALVERLDTSIKFPFGSHLLGQVVDGIGRPIGGTAPPEGAELRTARAEAPDPMARPLIEHPLQTGLRAIDAFATIGRGQRIGIFGPAGTGKSTLLASIASQTDADVIVIGLIGERGREVREFLQRHLPEEKRSRVVVVVSTSNRPPMERLYAAHVATSIAEGFRDEGKSVLLMVDSLTRVARALREIGLAAGEPPTRRGYPASVYPALPALIERSGRGEKGDITALYTVLVEGDGTSDPIAEEARSLTDGHIELTPKLASAGQYPAIDVTRSLSRVMSDIVPPEHTKAANQARALITKFASIEMLVQIGEYQPGKDPAADRAIQAMPQIEALLRQGPDERSMLSEAVAKLKAIVS